MSGIKGAFFKKLNNSTPNTQKRLINEIPLPIADLLQIEDLFDDQFGADVPNLNKLRNHLIGEGRLSSELVLKIIKLTGNLLKKETNLLRLVSPINLIGDIHGQFYDLLTIFTLGGNPESISYLFLGDFVDRGMFAFECVCYLYCLKLKYPNRIYLLRGNHECRHLTRYFTFRDECLFKSNEHVYEQFMVSFDCLPLAAIVDNKFFCVHGGLSPLLTKLKDLNEINRFKEIPKQGLLCDLMWSDPIDDFDSNKQQQQQTTTTTNHLNTKNSSTSLKQKKSGEIGGDKKTLNKKTSANDKRDYFIHNSTRGCSFYYTNLAVKRFLEENNLLCLIRAHQVQREGIHLSCSLTAKKCFLNSQGDDDDEEADKSMTSPESDSGSSSSNCNQLNEFPSLITIFSAPNYCDVYQNKAAIVQLISNEFKIKLFTAADHPFVLPSFQNAFSWSLPFIYEKLSEILVLILNQISDEEINDEETQDETDETNEPATKGLNHQQSDKEKSSLFKAGKTLEPLIKKLNLKFKLRKKAKKEESRSLQFERGRDDRQQTSKKLKEGLRQKLNSVKKYHDAYQRENELTNSDLKLGTLSPSLRVRRRSSDADRELLLKLEQKGVGSFEDANNLDSLQYKIINSSNDD